MSYCLVWGMLWVVLIELLKIVCKDVEQGQSALGMGPER